MIGQVQVDQFARRRRLECQPFFHQVGSGPCENAVVLLKAHFILGVGQKPLRPDVDVSLDTMFRNENPASSVPVHPLQVHGLDVPLDAWMIHTHPAPHDTAVLEVVVDVEKKAQAFKFGFVEGVSRHVNVRAEQSTPGRRIITVRVPRVGHVVDLVGGKQVTGVVVRDVFRLAIGKLEARPVLEVFPVQGHSSAVHSLEGAVGVRVQEAA